MIASDNFGINPSGDCKSHIAYLLISISSTDLRLKNYRLYIFLMFSRPLILCGFPGGIVRQGSAGQRQHDLISRQVLVDIPSIISAAGSPSRTMLGIACILWCGNKASTVISKIDRDWIYTGRIHGSTCAYSSASRTGSPNLIQLDIFVQPRVKGVNHDLFVRLKHHKRGSLVYPQSGKSWRAMLPDVCPLSEDLRVPFPTQEYLHFAAMHATAQTCGLLKKGLRQGLD